MVDIDRDIGKALNRLAKFTLGNDDCAAELDVSWSSDGRRYWLRIDVRDADSSLWLMVNPIFLNR